MKQEPEGFNDFWQFWMKTKRHTDGRGKCRKEYQRQLNEGATPEDILLAAQFHVRNTKDLAFIPLAATWLNSEAWVDEAPKERAHLEAMEQRKETAANRTENVVPIRAATGQTAFLKEWNAKQKEA